MDQELLCATPHLSLLACQAEECLANGKTDDCKGPEEEDDAAHCLEHAELYFRDPCSFATEQRQQALGGQAGAVEDSARRILRCAALPCTPGA